MCSDFVAETSRVDQDWVVINQLAISYNKVIERQKEKSERPSGMKQGHPTYSSELFYYKFSKAPLLVVNVQD